jgi:hypothetical protein
MSGVPGLRDCGSRSAGTGGSSWGRRGEARVRAADLVRDAVQRRAWASGWCSGAWPSRWSTSTARRRGSPRGSIRSRVGDGGDDLSLGAAPVGACTRWWRSRWRTSGFRRGHAARVPLALAPDLRRPGVGPDSATRSTRSRSSRRSRAWRLRSALARSRSTPGWRSCSACRWDADAGRADRRDHGRGDGIGGAGAWDGYPAAERGEHGARGAADGDGDPRQRGRRVPRSTIENTGAYLQLTAVQFSFRTGAINPRGLGPG